jgi:ankyrin repeat protein
MSNITVFMLRCQQHYTLAYLHHEITAKLLMLPNSRTFYAALFNQEEHLKTWLTAKYMNMNPDPNYDYNPLFAATFTGYFNGVRLLLDKGALVNAVDCRGATPLSYAAKAGHLDIVRLLLDRGALVNPIRRDDGTTPLFLATEEGHFDIVRLLLNSGAFVNATSTEDGLSPLFIAAQEGHFDIVRLLLNSGALVNAISTGDGVSPLFIAAQEGHFGIVSLLLERGALVNAICMDDGTTPLFIAAQGGHLEIVRLLLDRGAVLEAARTDGITPLFIAADAPHLEIVRLLLLRDADCTLQFQEKKLAFEARAHPAIKQLLLAAEIKQELKKMKGVSRSPSIFGSANGLQIQALQKLLEHVEDTLPLDAMTQPEKDALTNSVPLQSIYQRAISITPQKVGLEKKP